MNLQAWDIRLIQLLQDCGDWMKPVMEFFTSLGYPQAYMVIVAMVYWSFDRKLGIRMAIFLPLLSSVNSLLKIAIHAPRPYWISNEIKAIHASAGYGMPSGHAQASTVWLLASSYLRKRWFWISALCIIFMIGLSRVYLGVHSPTQVITGWAVGIIALICFIRLEERLATWMNGIKVYIQLLFVLGITLLILLAGVAILLSTGQWEIPEEWIAHAAPHIALHTDLLRSYSMASAAGNAGGFLGVATGLVLMGHAGNFKVTAKWWIRLLRIILGLACMLLLYAGLQSISPEEADLIPYAIWRFTGFCLISFTAVFLLPILYIRLKLTKSDQ
jgi:hypothetical protein